MERLHFISGDRLWTFVLFEESGMYLIGIVTAEL